MKSSEAFRHARIGGPPSPESRMALYLARRNLMTTTVSAPLNHPLRRVIGHCSYRLGHTTFKIIKTELLHGNLRGPEGKSACVGQDRRVLVRVVM